MTFDFLECIVHHSKVGCSTSATDHELPSRRSGNRSVHAPITDMVPQRDRCSDVPMPDFCTAARSVLFTNDSNGVERRLMLKRPRNAPFKGGYVIDHPEKGLGGASC